MVQPDFKKLIGVFVRRTSIRDARIWALTLQSVQGALLIMNNHWISTGALFFLGRMIYERGIPADRRGKAALRVWCAVPGAPHDRLVIVIALPGTRFVGEFLVLLGSFRTYPIATALATTGVIVAAAYLLTACSV